MLPLQRVENPTRHLVLAVAIADENEVSHDRSAWTGSFGKQDRKAARYKVGAVPFFLDAPRNRLVPALLEAACDPNGRDPGNATRTIGMA